MKTENAPPIACIILAAGKGTRMNSRTPKVMHTVAHRPMLFQVIDTASQIRAATIVTVTSPDMGPVRDVVTQRYRDAVVHAIQKEALGTGDAVKAALPELPRDGIVLVLYGDTPLILPQTLAAMVERLAREPELALVVLGMEVTAANEYGRLVLGSEGDLERIVETREASAGEKKITLCYSGVMAVRMKHFGKLLGKITNDNAKGEYYLTDLIALARAAELRCGVATTSHLEVMGVNSRVELANAEAVMQSRLRRKAMEGGATLLNPDSVFFSYDTRIGQDVTIHPNVVFGPGVEIASHVTIHSFSHIVGAKVSENAIIGPFARLRPGAVVGVNAHIGNFVEIKQAEIGDGSKVNHLSYIGDAMIGDNVNIGAGTITCNYDGFQKHRTHIGAGVHVGSNTSIVAPVTIGEGAIIGAGSVITEDVENDALAIARAPQKQKPGWARSFRSRKRN